MSNLSTRSLAERVTPWVSMPYDEQLCRKSEKYTEII
jgi:hypothetical protein